MDYTAQEKALLDERQRLWADNKMILDDVLGGEGRDWTPDERESYERRDARIDELSARIEDVRRAMRLDAETAEARAAHLDAVAPVGQPAPAGEARSDADLIRAIARGEMRGYDFLPGAEQRATVKTQTGAPVPTSFYDQIVRKLVLVGPMLDPSVSQILSTDSGENLQIPRTDAYGTVGIPGEGTAAPTSNPTFQAFITLGAYGYRRLTQASEELVEDSGVDIVSYLADAMALSMGTAVNADLTLGTGTVEPRGVVTGAAAGGTGANGTAANGGFTYEDVIDLQYSVSTPYRRDPSAGWMMNRDGIKMARKLVDGAGQYIWGPSAIAGEPDTLAGYRVIENPDMASPGTAEKSVLFGAYRAGYYVRQVRGLRLDRSDEFAFNTGLITWRATMRVDAAVVNSDAIKYFVGGTV